MLSICNIYFRTEIPEPEPEDEGANEGEETFEEEPDAGDSSSPTPISSTSTDSDQKSKSFVKKEDEATMSEEGSSSFDSPQVSSANADAFSTDESKNKEDELPPDLESSFDPNVGTVAPSVSAATAKASLFSTAAASAIVNEEAGHFLGLEAPPGGIAGPLLLPTTQDQPRSMDRRRRPPLAAELPSRRDLKKTSRRADAAPDVNDILSGLLNVVGEGLNIATNYVKNKEKEKRKQQQLLQEDSNSSSGESQQVQKKKKKFASPRPLTPQIRPSR